MRHKYGMKASVEGLKKKWNDSGMTDCKSMPEFLLRLEVMHVQIDGDDLVFLSKFASGNADFCHVMADLVKSTMLFDKALMELEFYIDYYIAMSADAKPDPLKYGHIRLFDMFETGVLTHNFADGSAGMNFIKACIDKVDSLFNGRLSHVKHFRQWLGVLEK